VKIPEPLNVRKVSQNTSTAKSALASSLQDAQRHTSYGSHQKGQSTEGSGSDAVQSKKRVSSWFKRSSKETASGSSFATGTDGSVQSRDTLAESEASNLTRPMSQSTDDPSLRRAHKKKSFGFAFWKGGKEEAKMSLAGKHANPAVKLTMT
jgi:hypothetical protein